MVEVLLLIAVVLTGILVTGNRVYRCLCSLQGRSFKEGSDSNQLESGFEQTRNVTANSVTFHVESDGQGGCPDYSASAPDHVGLPLNVKSYISDIVIPYFMDQRAGFQFAVVVLLSETDFQNLNKVKLIPSGVDGKPQIDNSQRTMPPSAEYCNYIVARPTISERVHSEKEIFGKHEDSKNSRFDELWNAYCLHHPLQPKYILIYSWNLPCEDCSNWIIRSLKKSPYECATVFIAHTSEWRDESASQRQKNKEKLRDHGIIVEEVQYQIHICKQYARFVQH